MANLIFPKIGLGTWKLKPKQAEYSVVQGIKAGYRFIDTAQAYFNEKGVGKGLKTIFDTTKIKRQDLIIATKINPMNLRPKVAYKSALKSLDKLELDYVDILYIHYPAFRLGYSHKKTLPILSQLVDEGKIKHIGVSNFTPSMVADAMKSIPHPIIANQIEMHPYLQQNKMVEYLKNKNIHLIAYSPLGRGNVFADPVLKQIADKNQVSVAQVCLAWIIDKGAIPIPKATGLDHIKDNLDATKASLSDEDIRSIDEISIKQRYVHPPFISPKEWKQ